MSEEITSGKTGQKMENTTYIFLPFSFGGRDNYRPLVNRVKESGSWEKEVIKVKYMLRYVADKLDSGNEDTCQCFQFRITDSARTEYGIPRSDEWLSTVPFMLNGEKVNALFRIVDVKLFCFRTGVGIMAFRISFENEDPFSISNAMFYLKKVSKKHIVINNADGSKTKTNFLTMARALGSEFRDIDEFRFFFYTYEEKERANALIFLTAESKPDFSRELFYLRRCYSEGYKYLKNEKQEEEELHNPSAGMNWGVSPEAAVCIACPDAGIGNFLETQFFGNFNTQYLLMYVLLLHQKYVLYMYLTTIGNSDRNDLETLEQYKTQLYAFETDFVFSCITEVPQYQILYDKISRAFSLKNMYEDVHEPLLSLGEVRRAAKEKEQAERDKTLNKALLLLSALSVFSALVDSYDFIKESFTDFTSGGSYAIKAVQLLFMVIILVIMVYVFINYNKSKKL